MLFRSDLPFGTVYARSSTSDTTTKYTLPKISQYHACYLVSCIVNQILGRRGRSFTNHTCLHIMDESSVSITSSCENDSFRMSSLDGALKDAELADIPNALIFTNLPHSIFDRSEDNPIKVSFYPRHLSLAPSILLNKYLSFRQNLRERYKHLITASRSPTCRISVGRALNSVRV